MVLETALAGVLLAVPPILAVVVCLVAYRRIRTEPRRLGNAYWLLGGLVLAGNVLATLGLVEGDPVLTVVLMLTLLSPLLALVLAVFLVLNGAVMLRRERARLGNLLSLLVGLLILGLLAVSVPVLLAAPGWLRALWLLCVLATAYLAFQFVAFLGYAWLYARIVRTWPAEWVVVLGSGLLPGGTVPPLLASRIRTGMEELARRNARMLVMSGGKGANEPLPEAEAMARWAVEHGADPAVVRTETQSRSTEQNLRYSAALLRGQVGPETPGVVVTSDYHMFRAAILARRTGLPAQAIGAPTAGYYWPSAVIREFVAILYDHRITHAVLLVLFAVPLPLLLLLVG